VLVDELAHTNAPGSRHTKRCRDVQELLDNGIDVFTTLNVQHVESRAEAVRQITGITIRETLPDTALDGVDLELVDLPPEELRARLAAGKVYVPESARAAQENFFRPGNLTALRELALRMVAEQVDKDKPADLDARIAAWDAITKNEKFAGSEAVKRAEEWPGLMGMDYVKEVTHKEAFVWDQKDKQSANQRGNGRQSKEEPVAEEAEKNDGNENPEDRAEVVHRPEKPEMLAPILVGRNVGHFSVPGSAPDLSDPVQDPKRDEMLPDAGEGIAEPRNSAAKITRPDEDFSLFYPVREVS
jgi:hypothetical protein